MLIWTDERKTERQREREFGLGRWMCWCTNLTPGPAACSGPERRQPEARAAALPRGPVPSPPLQGRAVERRGQAGDSDCAFHHLRALRP